MLSRARDREKEKERDVFTQSRRERAHVGVRRRRCCLISIQLWVNGGFSRSVGVACNFFFIAKIEIDYIQVI